MMETCLNKSWKEIGCVLNVELIISVVELFVSNVMLPNLDQHHLLLHQVQWKKRRNKKKLKRKLVKL